MAPFSINRNLLLIALMQLTASAAATGMLACNGFFCPEEPYTRESQQEAPCTGFGCTEEDSQDNANQLEDSVGECSIVSFKMTTDASPEDTSFELTCNGAQVWSFPSGSLPAKGPHETMDVKSCVYLREDTCCEFTIRDSARDGLMNGGHANLSLEVDGEEILFYDTLESPPFESLKRTFGSACKAEEEQASVCPEDETLARFEITLDDKPEETSWYLICDDVATGKMATLWNAPRGSLSQPKQAIEETACISAASTCAFSIVDSAGDGLDFGGYSLTFGDDLIDLYDTEPFQDKSYCIGQLCAPSLQKAAQEALDQTQAAQLADVVGEVVDAVIFDSSSRDAAWFEDDDMSSSSDVSYPGLLTQKRTPGPDFVSEGSTGDISLEAGAYAVIGVACLLGLIVAVAACITSSGQSIATSSSAAQDALAPSKSGDTDDGATCLSDDDEPIV